MRADMFLQQDLTEIIKHLKTSLDSENKKNHLQEDSLEKDVSILKQNLECQKILTERLQKQLQDGKEQSDGLQQKMSQVEEKSKGVLFDCH